MITTTAMKKWGWKTGRWGFFCLLVSGFIGTGWGETKKAEPADAPAPAAEALRAQWGIEITSLRLSGQGYFLDFRYKVLDPDKAAPLANKENKPLLIHEKSGKQLSVPTTPKLGSLRQTAEKLKVGQVYFMFFSNRSGVLKAGDKVTVAIGDCRLEHLTVE